MINNGLQKVIIQTVKDTKDIDIYSIPSTELENLPRVFDTLKRDIKHKTRKPKDVLILLIVK
jgi:hypothetical protein